MSGINKQLEADFEEAMQLRALGKIDAALVLLLELHKREPDSYAIAGTIAAMYWHELQDLGQALEWFRRTTILKPDSEGASIGVFHCLWELGDHDAAREELSRWLQHGKPPARYAEILDAFENDNDDTDVH